MQNVPINQLHKFFLTYFHKSFTVWWNVGSLSTNLRSTICSLLGYWSTKRKKTQTVKSDEMYNKKFLAICPVTTFPTVIEWLLNCDISNITTIIPRWVSVDDPERIRFQISFNKLFLALIFSLTYFFQKKLHWIYPSMVNTQQIYTASCVAVLIIISQDRHLLFSPAETNYVIILILKNVSDKIC